MRITPNTMGISRGYNNNNMCMYIYIYGNIPPTNDIDEYCDICITMFMQVSYWLLVWLGDSQQPNWESFIKKPWISVLRSFCQSILLSNTGCFIGMSTMDYPLVMTNITMENPAFFMGKSTISMAIFNSYVKLPEGMIINRSVSNPAQGP